MTDTRYWFNPRFKAAIDHERERAHAEDEGGGWITSAIHDPTTPDTVGEFNTLVIYVGQTKKFGVRVNSRLRAAGMAVKRPTDRIDGALYNVMARGVVPRFRVIERAPDAIASFVSETNWAKHTSGRDTRSATNGRNRHSLGATSIDTLFHMRVCGG